VTNSALQSVTPDVTNSVMTSHPLAAARKQAGLSQERLAKLIEMNRVTVARIELRQQAPSLATISKIISALGSKNIVISADAFLSANT